MPRKKSRPAAWQVTIALLLAAIALFGLEGVPIRAAGPQRQLVQAARTPRRAPIRLSPSRRALRVQSFVAAGSVPLVPCRPPLNEPVAPNTAGMPASVVAIPPVEPFEVILRRDVYLPGAPRVQHYDSALPMICTSAQPSAEQAYAVSPAGERVPALVVPLRGRAAWWVVTLPLAAYAQPGAWQLVVEDGDRYVVDVIVSPVAVPTALFGGDEILLTGFAPGEWVKVVLFASGDPDYEYAGEVDLLADDGGSVLLARPDAAQNYTSLVLGEASPGYVSDFPVTLVQLTEPGPDSAAIQARAAAPATAAPATAGPPSAPPAASAALAGDAVGVVYEADTFFAEIARVFFFQEEERPIEQLQDDQPVDKAPTGLPDTGAARVPPSTAAVLVTVVLLSAAGGLAAMYRRR